MSVVPSEQVLVVPTQLFHEIGYFKGFQRDVERYLARLLNSENTSYRPREQMEQDPSFKQLIPYVIFEYRHPGGQLEVFQYRRGNGQGERRLHSKRSVGVGGHISSQDADGQDAYSEGMRRELEEEIEIRAPYRQRCVGLINDDDTEVGRVHLGVVHLCEVQQPQIEPREADIVAAGFRPLAELLDGLDEFESWSRICLEALYGRPT